MKGKVKWFRDAKGYGFIVGEDEKDYFVHFKQIKMDGFKTLRGGQTVKFEPGTDERGRECAVEVEAI